MVIPVADISFFFFNDTATTEIYTLSLHDALPISCPRDLLRTSSARKFSASESRWPAKKIPQSVRLVEQTIRFLGCSPAACPMLRRAGVLFSSSHAARLADPQSCRFPVCAALQFPLRLAAPRDKDIHSLSRNPIIPAPTSFPLSQIPVAKARCSVARHIRFLEPLSRPIPIGPTAPS